MQNTSELSDVRRNIVVIGASAGGISALRRLAADLPPQFPAAILIVLHVGANRSHLPALLAAAGPNTAAHAQDGELLRIGHLAVAPPDYHLLVSDGSLRLSRGPKENFARPAIDPLFRSAALSYGPRVIGVVLTGRLDDGTAGLQAIKECGGLAVIQDPSTAFAPDMPASARDHVAVDYCVPIESVGRTLSGLVQQPSPPAMRPPPAWQHEHAPAAGTVNAMNDLKAIAKPSPLVCPECGGGLWEINQAPPPRYRCHTGHGYSLRSLEYAMNETTEDALWAAVRALQERAVVTRRIGEESHGLGRMPNALEAESRA
ncbi:MAG: protein-glutamate methylesterase (protein methylesterase)-like protein, partial [Gammaproteobacteria bacterium]|nr:protein-glutamate methylesterase (protein methylesterase)-like protein [Gammaproteobacteria bacterium]